MTPINFSVIIPTTGQRPKFLDEALFSVKSQIYPPLEIIIVNNSSQDISISHDLKNLVTVHKFNKKYTPGASRNYGVLFTKSKFLAFLDDDDKWDFNYLNCAKDSILQNHSEILVSKIVQEKHQDLVDFKNPITAIEKLSVKDFSNSILSNPGFTGSNLIIKKDIFNFLNGFNEDLKTGEDKAIIIDCVLNGYRVNFLDKTHVIFRKGDYRRQTNLQFNRKNGMKFFRVYKHLLPLNLRIKFLIQILLR